MVSSKEELHCSVLRVRTFIRKSGDNSEEVTPVPISNTVVKLLSADDTWREAAWESRTLPVFYCRKMIAVAIQKILSKKIKLMVDNMCIIW